jgi:hydroxypyruvate isomerase
VEQARADTGQDNIGFLFDTFHLATSGDDLDRVVDEYAHLVAHVQIADAPGRGEPGTGSVDVAGVIERLWEAGYRGTVACEYKPTVGTEKSLGWIAGVPRLAGLG